MSESKQERLDKEHEQLFHELRAVIPGAEVLFAFLLSVSFTERFEQLTTFDRRVYLAVFLLSATALVLLLAPAAFHRVRFRQRDKEAMLRIANREAIVAMILISLSVAGAVYLVTKMISGPGTALAIALGLWAFSVVMWWVVPLSRRIREGPDGVAGDDAAVGEDDGPQRNR